MTDIQTRDDGSQYVDLTPTWQQILPTWLMLYRQAIIGKKIDDPAKVIANAEAEFQRMAEAADKWNAHCKTTEPKS